MALVSMNCRTPVHDLASNPVVRLEATCLFSHFFFSLGYSPAIAMALASDRYPIAKRLGVGVCGSRSFQSPSSINEELESKATMER